MDLESDMSREKFLTVMAVLDDATQEVMSKAQGEIISMIADGTQTMGIPFHITLGSYPISCENEISSLIKDIASGTDEFTIQFMGYNDFGNRVLYLEPVITDELLALRERFKSDYANGYDWVPHATVFCGEEQEVERAKDILDKLDFPIQSKIVAIELGEFFPPRKILKEDFK